MFQACGSNYRKRQRTENSHQLHEGLDVERPAHEPDKLAVLAQVRGVQGPGCCFRRLQGVSHTDDSLNSSHADMRLAGHLPSGDLSQRY
jgi:hypothetical protein